MQVSTGKVPSVRGERKVRAEVINRNQIACHVGHSKSHYVVVERNGVRTEPKLHIVHDSACYQCDTTEQTLTTGYTTTTGTTTTAPPRPPQGYCDNETLVSLITFMNIYFFTGLHYHATCPISGC